ncbi:hypothetical protein SBV1_2720003 [Verrucomicrobia bacterium]|nr:hypothetical protein SBV1_2720003 [Verrucomicrobiota bacterium]
MSILTLRDNLTRRVKYDASSGHGLNLQLGVFLDTGANYLADFSPQAPGDRRWAAW